MIIKVIIKERYRFLSRMNFYVFSGNEKDIVVGMAERNCELLRFYIFYILIRFLSLLRILEVTLLSCEISIESRVKFAKRITSAALHLDIQFYPNRNVLLVFVSDQYRRSRYDKIMLYARIFSEGVKSSLLNLLFRD